MIILYLILCFELKHLAADVSFQTTWMNQGKRLPHPMYIAPLGCHALVHAAALTLVLVLIDSIIPFNGSYLPLIMIASDFITHFIIDRLRALYWDTPRGMILDQFLHHVQYAIFILILWRYFL